MKKGNVPLLGVSSDSIITSDYGASIFYRYWTLSMEGQTYEELYETMRRLDGIIRGVPATNVYLQFTIEIIPVPKSVLDKHVEVRSKNEIDALIADKRRMVFRSAIWWRNTLIIHVPINMMIVEKQGVEKAIDYRGRVLSDVRSYIEENMRAGLNMRFQRLSGSEAYKLICQQMNPAMPEDELPDIAVPEESGYIAYPETEKYLTVRVSDRFNNMDAMEDSEGFYEVMTLDNIAAESIARPMSLSFFLQKIQFPIRLSFSVYIPDRDILVKQIEKRSFWANIFSSKRRAATSANRKIVERTREFFEYLSEKGVRPVAISLTITFWENNIRDLKRKESRIRTLINSELPGAIVYREVFQRPVAFIGSIAGFPANALRWRWAGSDLAASMLPVYGPFVGTVESPKLMFSNRWNTVSFFDLFSQRANRWAFLVIAPTGSGKSVLTNAIIQSILYDDPQPFVCVVDLASVSSYRPLAEILGGQYVEVSYDKDMALNLFDFRLGLNGPSPSDLAFVEDILSDMLCEPGEIDLPKDVRSVLRRAIKRCYQRVLEEYPKRIPQSVREEDARYRDFETWVEARESWLKKAELVKVKKSEIEEIDRAVDFASYAHRQAIPTLDDLANTLASDDAVLATSFDRDIAQKLRRKIDTYIEGAASYLFNAPTGFSFRSGFVVLSLKFLKDTIEHLIPFFIILRRHIYMHSVYLEGEIPERMISIYGRDYYTRLQRRMKAIIYDEFHNFKYSPQVLKLVDKDSRQQRALGMLWGIITQSLRDVDFESEDLKINLATSAGSVMLLRHSEPNNPREMEVKYVADKMGLNRAETDLLRSLVLDPGHYSEILLMSEGIGRGVVRLTLTPHELWLYTTHPKERPFRDAIIDEIQKQLGISRTEAVKRVLDYLARNYPNGIRLRTDQVSVDRAVQEIKIDYLERTSRKFLRVGRS